MLTSIAGFLFKDVQSMVVSLILGLVTIIIFYTFKFYFVTLSKYPNGPLPLPILGNILCKFFHFLNLVFKFDCPQCLEGG